MYLECTATYEIDVFDVLKDDESLLSNGHGDPIDKNQQTIV